MAASSIPSLLFAINVATVAALGIGRLQVARGDTGGHRRTMLVATALGVVFMVLYATYHLGAGLAKFGGTGLVRPIYFTILATHIVAAAVAALAVPLHVFYALSGRTAAHKRLAPWVWPLWFFVATSGIVIYVMVMLLWPHQGA